MATAAATAAEEAPVAAAILAKLTDAFAPAHLEVLNESGNHNVPRGSETHFKVVVVADAFEGQSLVKRHRMVYAALEDEIAAGVHALSMVTKTPQQWEAQPAVAQSPACVGGFGR